MGKIKDEYLRIELSFTGSVRIPAQSFNIIDESISRGELAFDVELEDSDGSFSFSVYPDSVNGLFKSERSGDQLSVNVEAIYLLPYGKFERDNLRLPAKIKAYSVSDADATAYYFGDDEDGIYIGEVTNMNLTK
jgi:hypothetical protein